MGCSRKTIHLLNQKVRDYHSKCHSVINIQIIFCHFCHYGRVKGHIFFLYILKHFELVLRVYLKIFKVVKQVWERLYLTLLCCCISQLTPRQKNPLDSVSCYRNTHIKAQSSIKCLIIIILITCTDYSLRSKLKSSQQSECQNKYWRKNTDRKVFMWHESMVLIKFSYILLYVFGIRLDQQKSFKVQLR